MARLSCVPEKTKGEVRLDHNEIDIPDGRQADATALADRRRCLPGASLAFDPELRKFSTQQAGHPVDVGLLVLC